MKKKMTLALASSMFALALAAAPHRALAASDVYLNLDGIKGEAASHAAPAPSNPIFDAILSFFASL